MIKEVENIPVLGNRRSNRDKIRADIKEAIENGISRFEFLGDFNYSRLAIYANEEAEEIVREIIRKFAIERKEKYGDSVNYVRNVWFNRFFREGVRDYIHFVRAKQKDRIHVYGEIIPENLKKLFEKTMQEAKEYWGKMEEVRAKREKNKGAKHDD